MILIRKRPPPQALTTYRLTPDSTGEQPRAARYNDDDPHFTTVVKPAMREALVREQRGLCCYCNDRIEATDTGMKIEHRVPQHGPWRDPSRDLDWTNLLGACCGAIDNPRGRGAKVLHCDSSKAERPVALDPTEASHTAAIEYENGGRIHATRPEFDRDLDEVLNLNDETLVERRDKALTVLMHELRKRYGVGSWKASQFQKLLDQHRDPPGGSLRPFAGYLCWWLERAVRKSR